MTCEVDRQGRVASRRQFLSRCGNGFGAMAFSALLAETSRADASSTGPLAVRTPHFAPKARRVVHIFMNGGMSHIDTFDPKPELNRRHGQPLPSPNLSTERPTGAALGSPFKFQQHGQSGIPVSELFPHVAQSVDDMCIIRSMHADVPNHEPSLMLMNCGDARQVRPAMGSWVVYGLGSDNQNLPGFVVMCPKGYPIAETQNWQSGFLPGVYQGTYIDPVHTQLDKLIEHIDNKRASLAEQRAQLELLERLNKRYSRGRELDQAVESRSHSFELAYRMQIDATDAFDVDREPSYVREMYGQGVHARMMLATRRLLERGVRYVQLWHGEGQPWDSHDDLEQQHRNLAGQCDQPIGAFLKDLKMRGMLEDTLVFCSGEFGRTPTVELPTPGANAGKMNGRDHNHYGFTAWLAGGGVKGGTIYGATDEFGFKAVENPVHVHDLHATILHLLGFDHEKLTYRFAGRDFRLTDVHGRVIQDICA
jgi:hypothetical protein